MYLIDTNVVSEWLRPQPDPSVMTWTQAHADDALFLSAVSLAEIWQGIEGRPVGARRQHLAEHVLHLMDTKFADKVLPFDAAAAIAFSRLVVERRRAGHPIGFADAQIAATAKSRGLVLVTRNGRDFEGVGVTILDPWAG
jgi:toxin FitB